MENIKFLALDEADRMLDMGFEPAIRNITELYGMPESGEDGRQTIMFSATFAEDMQDMALDYLDPAHMQINVGKVGATASDVEQRFIDVRGFGVDKFTHLRESIEGVRDEDGQIARTIVFTNMKRTADDICYRLRGSGVSATPIHGDIEQRDRNQAIRDIKDGRTSVLVATDVAARGLDLPAIGHVINFDLPMNGDDYVHRIGRTGRIGNKGVATSLVGDGEASIRSIVNTLNEAHSNDPECEPAPDWLAGY
jgi:superfamily II DNA/RNA helicase